MMQNEISDIDQQEKLNELFERSKQLSKQIIQITTEAGSGHPSSSLSAIDIMVALYFGGIMQYKADDPRWLDRDRFILSKGHGVPGLYVTMANAGFFAPELLATFRKLGSPLEGHPNMRVLAGLDASTGSLGQGLSIGLGHALAARWSADPYRVYVLIGDGESDEGQIWEAAMTAAKYKVDNLTAILDFNKFQQTGSVNEVMPSLMPVIDKWKAFGWWVTEIDGHDMKEILLTFNKAKTIQGQPQMIIAHTKKGKGLSPFESDDVNRKHGEPLNNDEAQIAYKELDLMEQPFVEGN